MNCGRDTGWKEERLVKVVVRTHGGLGNQLFQLLYAQLVSRKNNAPLFEVHDRNYPHAFDRSIEVPHHPSPGIFARLISRARLPKILMRFGKAGESIQMLGVAYLDGYFQSPIDYEPFDDDELARQLLYLRTALNVSTSPSREQGMHLRLGDFFTTEAAVTAHLEERLQRIGDGVWIITNEENRLSTPALSTMLATANARILPTETMSPEEVLRTLASFEQVDGNDSTLLFWASVLSGMRCNINNPDLRALRNRFVRVLDSADRATGTARS